MDRFIIRKILDSPIVGSFLSLMGFKRLWAEYRIYSAKKRFLAEAKKEYEKGSTLGSFEDYKQAVEKHLVSYNEYAHQYEFYKLSEDERGEFVSRRMMDYFYRRYIPFEVNSIFRVKPKFLTIFNKFIHRQWLFVPDTSFEKFKQLVVNYDCIVKPCDESLGKGIFKVYKGKTDCKELYDYCVKNRLLVEECVDSCEELKALHPESLNTIRVVTVSNKDKAVVFGSILRMGVGNSIVDNAHFGGVFAQINIKEGIIESDGVDVDGHTYTHHPDSGIKLKVSGWDVAINSNGGIEFIEGNASPDFDLMQSPLKVGVKKRLFSLIKEYSGVCIK